MNLPFAFAAQKPDRVSTKTATNNGNIEKNDGLELICVENIIVFDDKGRLVKLRGGVLRMVVGKFRRTWQLA